MLVSPPPYVRALASPIQTLSATRFAHLSRTQHEPLRVIRSHSRCARVLTYARLARALTYARLAPSLRSGARLADTNTVALAFLTDGVSV